MANWIIKFKTWSNKNAVITIGGFDEQSTLVGSTEPLVTSYDDDDDFFKFVRTQTGTLSFVGNYEHLLKLADSKPLDHPVTLTIDGSVRWRGFLKTESYNQKIDTIGDKISLSVMSMAEALKGVYLPLSHDVVSIGGMIKRMINVLGGGINYVYISSDVDIDTCMPAMMFTDSFVEVSDEMREDGTYYDRKAYGDVLEGICSLMGVQMHEEGDAWYFLHNDTDAKVNKIGFADLGNTRQDIINYHNAASVTECNRVSKSFDDLEYSSDEHKIDIIRGKRSITVDSDIRNVDELFKLDFDDYKYKQKDAQGLFTGYRYAGVYTDEVTLYNNDAFIRKLKGLAGDAEHGAAFYKIADYNTSNGKHSFKNAVVMYTGRTTPTSVIMSNPNMYIKVRKPVISTNNCFLNIKISGNVANDVNESYSGSEWWNDGGEYFYQLFYFMVKLGGKYMHISGTGSNRKIEWNNTAGYVQGSQIYTLNRPNLYEEDKSGIYIEIPSMNSYALEVGVFALGTSNGSIGKAVMVSDMSISLIRSVSVDDHFRQKDSKKECRFIGNSNEDDYSTEITLGCTRDGINAVNAVYDYWLEDKHDDEADEDYIEEHFTDIKSVLVNKKTPAEDLADRIKTHCSTSKFIMDIYTRGLGVVSVGDLFVANEKECAVLSKEVNWRDETEKLKIHQI